MFGIPIEITEEGESEIDENMTSVDYVEKKKRGRPPMSESERKISAERSLSYIRVPVSPSDRRKRGRPSKADLKYSNLKTSESGVVASPTHTILNPSQITRPSASGLKLILPESMPLTVSWGGGVGMNTGNDSRSSSLFRRSKRYRPPDPNKELVVLMPGDDPAEVLNIPPNELEEFLVSFYEPLEFDDDYEKDAHSCADSTNLSKLKDASEVLTPRVKEINSSLDFKLLGLDNTEIMNLEKPKPEVIPNLTKKKPSKSNKNSKSTFHLPRVGEPIPGYSYTEYDLDSDDDEFITGTRNRMKNSDSSSVSSSSCSSSSSSSSLSPASSFFESYCFTAEHLRRMISFLERELQESKAFVPLIEQSHSFHSSCDDYLTDSKSVLELLTDCFPDTDDPDLEPDPERYAKLLNELRDGVPSTFPSSFSTGSHTLANSSLKNRPASLRKNESFDSVNNLKLSSNVSATSSESTPLNPVSIYSIEEIKNILSEQQLLNPLRSIYNSVSSDLSSSVPVNISNEVLSTIFNYWVAKRSQSSCSLLRCYHDFMMENWSQQPSLPVLPGDDNIPALQESLDRLCMLRRDMDRARLIMDRVRRREKLKKELIKTSIESSITFIAQHERNEFAKGRIASRVRAAKTDAIGAIGSNPSLPVIEPHLPFSIDESNLFDITALLSSIQQPIPAPSVAAAPPLPPPPPAKINKSENKVIPIPKKQEHVAAIDEIRKRKARDNGKTKEELDIPNNDINDLKISNVNMRHAGVKWTLDEDKLLMLGLGVCGLNKMSEIREIFGLRREDSTMNQRFSKLSTQRLTFIASRKISKKSVLTAAQLALTLKPTHAMDDPVDAKAVHDSFSGCILKILSDFDEDLSWRQIVLRHLVDAYESEKKTGKSVKYPTQLPPLPKEYQNNGFLKYKYQLGKKPSAFPFSSSFLQSLSQSQSQEGSRRKSSRTDSSSNSNSNRK